VHSVACAVVDEISIYFWFLPMMIVHQWRSGYTWSGTTLASALYDATTAIICLGVFDMRTKDARLCVLVCVYGQILTNRSFRVSEIRRKNFKYSKSSALSYSSFLAKDRLQERQLFVSDCIMTSRSCKVSTCGIYAYHSLGDNESNIAIALNLLKMLGTTRYLLWYIHLMT